MTKRGFTLLEILVALAILAVVLTTVYGVLGTALSAKEHAEGRADLYAAGREAVLRMADELEGALPPSAGRNIGFIGLPSSEHGVPANAVQFASVVRRPTSASESRVGRALVSYSLDPMTDNPNLYALRRQEEMLSGPVPQDDLGEDDGTGLTTADPPPPIAFAAHLLDRVAGLRFNYLDTETGDFVESWDTTAERPTGSPPIELPLAVQITLFLADENGGIHDFGTIVDLPLARVPTPKR